MSKKLLCLLWILLPLADCRNTSSGRAATSVLPAGSPIILISIDTLRADHVPAYGYRGVDTPNLDALRRDAILFEDATSHSPLTLPSHVSIFSGLLPPEHRVRDNIGYHWEGKAHPSLTPFLKARGYSTGAAVSAYVLRSSTGLSESFDFYDDRMEAPREAEAASQVQRPGGDTSRAALAWMARVRAKPFFLFLHLYEPHSPYLPPEPFASRYRLPYDGEIAAADAIVGDFFARLKEWDLYDRSLILLLSDHGEALGEHGEDEHGILLYREVLRVPLLVKLPGAKRGGEVVRHPVQLIDVFPTIAGLIGHESPQGLAGRPLLETPRRDSPEHIYSETYYPRVHLGWSELRSLWDGRFHFIDSPEPELYDTREDPGEKVDLFANENAVARAMKRELNRTPANFALPDQVDSENVRKLAALGYLSMTSRAAEADLLPSPAENIALLSDVKTAFRLEAAGERDRAISAFRALLQKNPRLFDVQYKLAETLAHQKKFREAAQAYRRAIQISPSAAGEIALALARVSLELGEFKEAELNAQLAQRESPGEAHEVLARVALARNNLEAAEREARIATEVNRGVILGEIRLRREQPKEALAELDSALALFREKRRPVPPNLQFLRGDALARLHRDAEAEAAFREEIGAFPTNVQAYARLAILYAVEHRLVRDVYGVFESMYAARPTRETALLAAKTLDSMGDVKAAAAWHRRAQTGP